MSTAPLKFRPVGSTAALDPELFERAMESFPGPLAISENGKVLYANHGFAQISKSGERTGPAQEPGPEWEFTPFSFGGRVLALQSLRQPPDSAESQYLSLIGRLVSGVAHDFNNLLTGILLYCDLLGTTAVDPKQFTAKIEEIRAAAEKGAGLIRQLMTIGREEKDSPSHVSFPEALQDVLPLLRHLSGENIQIQTRFDARAGVVPISLAQAQQIVLNLVLNSRDAMPEGGVVTLEISSHTSAQPGADRIFEFKVSDSGKGMDSQTAARMFEPFFTTKARGRGTGMGLATVRRIVEEAGGTVEVKSAPGRGTCMTVRLPELDSNGGESPQIRLPSTINVSELKGAL